MTDSSGLPVRVFIGSGDASVLACRTLVHSLRRHTSRALDIWIFDGTHEAIERNEEPPVPAPLSLRIKYRQNTEFSFYRFLIPELCGHDGRAIYLDSDMICRSDIGELFDTPLGDNQFLSKAGRAPETWASSVMLIDCSRTRFDLEAIFHEIDCGRYSTEDFTSFSAAFRRHRPYNIGPLDPRWNEFDRCNPDTKLVHYTKLHSQPWKFPNHPFGELWFDYFRSACAQGEITPLDVSRSIDRGYARSDVMDGNRPGWPLLRRRLGRLTRMTRPVKMLLGILRQARIAIRHQKCSYVLRRLITGRRVLIIGSGPSARHLERIPEDVLVFACNLSPRALLHSPNRGRVVDLYIGNIETIRCYGKSMLDLLEAVQIRWFLSRDPGCARTLPGVLQRHQVLQDRSTGVEAYYLKRLKMDKEETVSEIPRSSRTPRISTGIALLQYALWYGAREINLIGIDLDSSGYAFQPGAPDLYQAKHSALDHAVVALCARQYQHIFCASPHSPLTRLFPYRTLE